MARAVFRLVTAEDGVTQLEAAHAYDVRERLRRRGFRYDGERKLWVLRGATRERLLQEMQNAVWDGCAVYQGDRLVSLDVIKRAWAQGAPA